MSNQEIDKSVFQAIDVWYARVEKEVDMAAQAACICAGLTDLLSDIDSPLDTNTKITEVFAHGKMLPSRWMLNQLSKGRAPCIQRGSVRADRDGRWYAICLAMAQVLSDDAQKFRHKRDLHLTPQRALELWSIVLRWIEELVVRQNEEDRHSQKLVGKPRKDSIGTDPCSILEIWLNQLGQTQIEKTVWRVWARQVLTDLDTLRRRNLPLTENELRQVGSRSVGRPMSQALLLLAKACEDVPETSDLAWAAVYAAVKLWDRDGIYPAAVSGLL